MRVDFHWRTYRYLPYEKVFARRELIALLGQEPVSSFDALSIEGQTGWEMLAYRTTYFREASAENGSRIVPLQAILESTANGGLQAGLPNMGMGHSIKRQSTRYSAHGLHEYRGKFNPQVVRAIGNMVGLKPGDWVLDPFCGSGTSLLEAAHNGWNAIGIDLNPLAVQIARAKIAAMCIPLVELHDQTESLRQGLCRRLGNVSFGQVFTRHQMDLIGGNNWQCRLPNFDYLCGWFTESVLVQVSTILDEIARLPSEDTRLILNVILSDILREVSLQDPADLRIRRRKFPSENAPVIPLYLDAMAGKMKTVLEARQHLPEVTTTQEALLGDARSCATIIRAKPKFAAEQRFDAAITSPPYATALPYIDTQRLSLMVLGLIKANKVRATERSLIGNREISTKERLAIERAMNNDAEHLPAECLSLCRELKESLDTNKDGFRRQNVPALIYKYFVEIRLMFREVQRLLRPGAPFALVVGPNKTHLGGQTWVVDTPRLLALLAERNGFAVQETLGLDAYQRFDVHQANSIRSETLLLLKALPYAG